MGRLGSAKHAEVPSEKDSVRVVLLGVVEGEALFPVLARQGKLSQVEQSAP